MTSDNDKEQAEAESVACYVAVHSEWGDEVLVASLDYQKAWAAGEAILKKRGISTRHLAIEDIPFVGPSE